MAYGACTPSSLRGLSGALRGVHHELREGDLDAALVESLLEPLQELALHVPLLDRRHDLEPAAQYHSGIVELLDAHDLDVVGELRFPLRVRAQRLADLAHHAERLVDVDAIADADLDRRLREAARAVAHHLDLAVRHEAHVPVEIAQPHVAQRHFLDQAALARDLHHVALPDLVLEQQEEAGEVILDQALGAEADRHPRDARGGEDRRDRDAERVEHQRAGDDEDDDGGGVAENARQRLDARDLVRAGAPAHVAAEQANQPGGDRLQQPGEQQNQDDAQRLRAECFDCAFGQCSPNEASMLRTMATRRGPRSSSSWPFFTMNAGTMQLNATISPSTVRRMGTPTACTSRRNSPVEAQKPRARMSSSPLSIEGRYLRCASGSFTFIWLSTASRSGGVQAARNARPMTEWEMGTEVPMSGRVVMPLPLRQDST